LRELTPTYESTAGNLNLKRAARQQIVYAYSKTNPKSTSISATMEQHDQGMYGAITVDLSKNVTFASSNTSADGNTTVSQPVVEEPTVSFAVFFRQGG
jgi:hypothetical protein